MLKKGASLWERASGDQRRREKSGNQAEVSGPEHSLLWDRQAGRKQERMQRNVELKNNERLEKFYQVVNILSK